MSKETNYHEEIRSLAEELCPVEMTEQQLCFIAGANDFLKNIHKPEVERLEKELSGAMEILQCIKEEVSNYGYIHPNDDTFIALELFLNKQVSR